MQPEKEGLQLEKNACQRTRKSFFFFGKKKNYQSVFLSLIFVYRIFYIANTSFINFKNFLSMSIKTMKLHNFFFFACSQAMLRLKNKKIFPCFVVKFLFCLLLFSVNMNDREKMIGKKKNVLNSVLFICLLKL